MPKPPPRPASEPAAGPTAESSGAAARVLAACRAKRAAVAKKGYGPDDVAHVHVGHDEGLGLLLAVLGDRLVSVVGGPREVDALAASPGRLSAAGLLEPPPRVVPLDELESVEWTDAQADLLTLRWGGGQRAGILFAGDGKERGKLLFWIASLVRGGRLDAARAEDRPMTAWERFGTALTLAAVPLLMGAGLYGVSLMPDDPAAGPRMGRAARLGGLAELLGPWALVLGAAAAAGVGWWLWPKGAGEAKAHAIRWK